VVEGGLDHGRQVGAADRPVAVLVVEVEDELELGLVVPEYQGDYRGLEALGVDLALVAGDYLEEPLRYLSVLDVE
jgi:hypothetical protein